jgi:hypothetical protein
MLRRQEENKMSVNNRQGLPPQDVLEARALALSLTDDDMAMALECIELALQGQNDGVGWRLRAKASADKFAAYLRAACAEHHERKGA